MRLDNSAQFAWRGKPLYYYAEGKNVGDTSGDNVDNARHIVRFWRLTPCALGTIT